MSKQKNVKLNSRERLSLISNLATMLVAGIPLLDTIDSLLEEAKANQRRVLLALKNDIGQGKKISDSLLELPGAFDPVTIFLIRASEEAGTLDETLQDLTITIKKEIEFADRIKGAFIYPAAVLVIFIAILTIILTFVIPRIAQVFLQLKVALPLPTRLLIGMSNLLINNTLMVILVLGLSIAGLVFLFRWQQKRMVRFLFSLPGLSTLSRDIDITRLSRSLALLLTSGIPIVNALDLARKVVVRKDIAEVVEQAHQMVLAGKPLSQGFKDPKKIIPGIVVRITQAGEKTGMLSKSMQDLADYFDVQVSNRIKTLTTLLEPLLLVFMAAFVGGMMLSIIAPIYSLIGSITTN